MIIAKIKNNWFLFGLGITLLLAFLSPRLGEILNPDKITTTAAVVVVFFLTGLSINTESVAKGVRNINLHIFLQLFIFIICPLYFFFTSFMFKETMSGYLVIGIYALACLPTTISSCVVFTASVNGNVVGSLFNAILSNFAGIICTPLLLTFMTQEAGLVLDVKEISRIIFNLLLIVLLPFIIGQSLRFFSTDFANKHQNKYSVINSLLILCIIFFAFSEAVANDSLRRELPYFVFPMMYLALSHIALTILAYSGGKLLGFPREDLLAIVFTAPQKTLAMGIPLLSTYFAHRPQVLGIAILPVIFYHPWQLLVAGLIKNSVFFLKLQSDRNNKGPHPGAVGK